jgi:hypothetical protein
VEDKGNVVYKIMLMYGIGLLVPWSVILSILDYLAAMVSIALVKG